MNADDLEMARRFAACKGWQWIPGMQAASKHDDERDCIPYRVIHVYPVGILAFVGRLDALGEDEACDIGLSECVPDLSDALTRAGVLPVVRQALDMPNLTPIIGADGWYLHGIPDDRLELWWSSGQPSELHALLAALEAAPHA